jgi:DNA polymerase-3 subunit beta
MQFVIARNALQKELAFVQGIVERKNTIPVLANILIESAGEDSIRISGTDLDVTIRCDAMLRRFPHKARSVFPRESCSTSRDCCLTRL